MAEEMMPSISGWLSCGWDAYKRHLVALMGGAAVLAIFGLMLTFMEQSGMGLALYYILFLFVYPVIWVGWYYICLRAVRGEKTSVGDLMVPLSRYGPVWVSYILFILALMAGILLLVIPGIILYLKYGFFGFAVMDKKCGGMEALKYSGKITKGHKGKLLIFVLLVILFGLCGAPFIFGIILENTFLVMIGILPYALSVLVISPWMQAGLAAAYESLRINYEKKMAELDTTKIISSKIA
jgi:uncharacterized membrane protein